MGTSASKSGCLWSLRGQFGAAVVFSDDPESAALASKLDVNFNWLGRMEQIDLIAAYQNCDGLLFPSCAEGFGLPVVEALAAGTWSFVADFPAHNMHLPEGQCLPKYDKQSWADAIEKNFHSERGMDKKSIQLAQRYSNEEFCKRIKNAWDELF